MSEQHLGGASPVERWGMGLLVFVLGGTLLFLSCAVFFGWILEPLALLEGESRRGIELAVVPLAALAGALGRRHLRCSVDRQGSWLQPFLALLPVGVLVGLGVYLAVMWFPALGPEVAPVWGRVLGGVLLAGAAFAGTVFYPRLMAFPAGAFGGATLVVALFLAFPGLQFDDVIDDGTERGLLWMISAAVSLSLCVIALLGVWRRGWPHGLGYVIGSGSLWFFLAVFGYLVGTGIS